MIYYNIETHKKQGIMRKNKKKNRFATAQEKRQAQQEYVQHRQKGYGLYVYENRLNATVTLPKVASDGITRVIQPKGTFQGDDYFMFMVPGELRVKQIVIPAEEDRKKENNMENQKLILDQPDTVTNEGVVERIVSSDLPLNENQPNEETKEVLLNEAPIEGVKVFKRKN